MRPFILALAILIAPLSAFAGMGLNELINKPSVQMALVINLRNPQMRQQLNQELSKHPGSWDKVNRFANSITHIAVVVIEEEGNQMAFLVAVGNFGKKTRQMLQQEGLPAELMDDKSVCLGIAINGQALTAEQIQQLAAAMAAKGGR